jgi:hypothetical protein
VTCRVEPGAGHNSPDLPAQVRHLAGGARIGARREEPDDAQLALNAPVRREQLDANVVEMRPPMHAGLHVGFGDDQKLGPRHEGADLGRDHHKLAAAAEHPHGGIAQQAEARAFDRIRRGVALRQAVFAEAQEREVAVGDPFEECHGLGDFLGVERGAVAIGPDDELDSRPHGAPVADCHGHVRVDPAEIGEEPLARFRAVEALELDMDEALAAHARLRR